MLHNFRSVGLCLVGAGALLAAPPQAARKAASGKTASTARAATKSAAAASSDPKSALNKQHLEAYVRHLYGWLPEVKVQISDFTPSPVPGLLETTVHATYELASQDKVFYVSADGKHIIDGAVYPADDNPFRDNLSKITTALQPSFGPAGAEVVIVAYSDFQCPHCREEAKSLRENITKTFPTQVRVYFKDFPLPNHDWAKTAAIAGRCIYRQNPQVFWQYHDWIFENQSEILTRNFSEKLNEFIQGKRVDPLQLNQCLEKRDTEAEVDKSIAEGKALGINSTPTVFVNGRKLSGATPWPTLQRVIELELDYQKAAKQSDEACCEVKLPTPFTQPQH
ncbi:MAG TPA: thioredoxin domain-containing protein [Bryobacterales bacterium]|jgi:protein-disulfide isomerase|nr:thioredoxin domain-containing protein [Bryobacterales bacterium]